MSTEIDRMFNVLAKHAQVPERPKEPEKPKVAIELKWQKPTSPNQTGVYTTCKRYTCAKVTVGGKAMYEVYRLAPKSEWYACIAAGLESFERAKAVAQRDWEKMQS